MGEFLGRMIGVRETLHHAALALENNIEQSNLMCAMAKYHSSEESFKMADNLVQFLSKEEGFLDNEYH